LKKHLIKGKNNGIIRVTLKKVAPFSFEEIYYV